MVMDFLYINRSAEEIVNVGKIKAYADCWQGNSIEEDLLTNNEPKNTKTETYDKYFFNVSIIIFKTL